MKEIRDVVKRGSNREYNELGGVTDFGVTFLISGMLAMVFKTVMAPLERVKLILQTQASSRQIGSSGRTAYTGFLDAIVRIPQQQGIMSMWRGNILNICRYFPTQAMNFSLYEVYYNAFRKIIHPHTNHGYMILPFLSGGAVGMTTCVVLFPLNFCNTRISVDVGDDKTIKREFVNFKDCLNKVYRSDGIRGFYQGMLFMATGMFIYRSAYFGVYANGKRIYLNLDPSDMSSDTVRMPFLMCIMLAQMSASIGTMIAYPLDTIGRQKMLYSGRGMIKKVTAQQVIRRIIQKDGPAGFYKGIVANLLSALCGSCVLATYDVLMGYYERYKGTKAISYTRSSSER